jgi:hypothetical protein
MKRAFLIGGAILVVMGLMASHSREGKAAKAAAGPSHAVFAPESIAWKEGPNSISPGTQMAVLEGNPAKAGLFTMRLRVPDGFKIQPHWHPAMEHVTVISGTFNIGMGSQFDESKGTAMPAGTFGFLAPRMHHFAWSTGETVLQLHGMGPWKIIYVNPADDPRNAKP